eukprot:TRINITY_DN51672_c0_g1_i1.p1 TRINITY_DN51672_c0_g1~~TRINITY_DN51672_c0_g1_i1.p1  ORF type:complete len:385 (-),score=88.42 TRINITY_DN51672_c0_g1_i1:42-1094(-)
MVGHTLVKQYYSLLDKDPAKLYRLYKEHSVFSHAQEGTWASVVSAVGQSEIHSKIMAIVGSLDSHSSKAELTSVECQESLQGGVLVLVTGYLTLSASGERRHFTQALCLGKQTEPYEGYYVLNDIFRFLPLETSSAARPATAAPSAAPTSAPAVAPTPAPAAAPTAVPTPAPVQVAPEAASKYEPPAESFQKEEEEEEYEEEAEVEEQHEEPAATEVAEAPAEAAEEVSPESKGPKSWASMAKDLGQGSAKLGPAKTRPPTGLSLPAPKASAPVLPPPTAEARAAAAAGSTTSPTVTEGSSPEGKGGKGGKRRGGKGSKGDREGGGKKGGKGSKGESWGSKGDSWRQHQQ